MRFKSYDILKYIWFLFLLGCITSCYQNNSSIKENSFESVSELMEDTSGGILNDSLNVPDTASTNSIRSTLKYLALGDSYTIGTSVCNTCSYPHQLKSKLTTLNNIDIDLNVIARAGWTTTDLMGAVNSENPSHDHDLVTLLIGVNNQYQQKSFTIYETEFPALLNKAILLANGNPKNVIVLSIPDYAYTPFGQNSNYPNLISSEIDNYNHYAKEISEDRKVKFINITDITRQGLIEPDLVASDGLHPSEKAYEKFVERLIPVCLEILN